jgi:CheY-like chemotaxis protein
MSDTPDPVPAVLEELAALEKRLGAAVEGASWIAEVRLGVHRLRSALTPVSNNLQYLSDEEKLSADGRSALVDAQAALSRALDGLEDMLGAVLTRVPRFPVSEALAGLPVSGQVPPAQIAGSPECLRGAVEALLLACGEGTRLAARIQGGCVLLEVAGGSALSLGSQPLKVARRLASLVGAEVEAIGQGARLRAPLASEARAAARRTLLVVDDEPELAAMFRRFLKREFDEILDARGPADAEEILRSHPVTHLVVDGHLPGAVSGQDLVQQWRRQQPAVRFAALFSGSTSLRGAVLPGIDGVFIKPEGFDELLAALKAS